MHRIDRIQIVALALCAASCRPGGAPRPDVSSPAPAARDATPGPGLAEALVDREPADGIAGTWRPVETVDQRERRLAAIEAATEDLGRLARGRAKSRLEERTTHTGTLRIDLGGTELGSTLSIVADAVRIDAALGGEPVGVGTGEDAARVTARWEAGRLVLIAATAGGRRTTTYRREGATLVAGVVLTSERLDAPVEYEVDHVWVR
ncbi:MAG: hypothetical protein AAFZ87_13685 [Planctomycetota bacterium]